MMLIDYQIEIRQIQYFLAVAEALHYRKAAERLFISQPALSRQIQQLEENLGLLLFERHNRKVRLTKTGEYLKKELTINLKNINTTLHHAKLLHDGKNGDVKLGYVGSAMQEIIPNLLEQLQKENPNIVFSLKELDNQKQIEGLLSFDLDIGFVRLERVPSTLQILPILKEPFYLVLPKNHPITIANFTSLAQLKNEPFILFDQQYSTSYYEKVMQLFDDSGFTPLVSHNTIHSSSIYTLVAKNFGVSIVPKSLARTTNVAVKFIPLTALKSTTVLSVVWNVNNRNPLVSKMLQLL